MSVRVSLVLPQQLVDEVEARARLEKKGIGIFAEMLLRMGLECLRDDDALEPKKVTRTYYKSPLHNRQTR